MDGYTNNPLIFLLQVALQFLTLTALLRFMLQALRANFFNPLSQFVVRVTEPALAPLRRVIPGGRRFDTVSLLAAWLLKTVELTLVLFYLSGEVALLAALFWAVPGLLQLAINIFIFALIVQAILSWVGANDTPVSALLWNFTEPVLRPIRRFIGPIGGIDLSPMIGVILLIALKMLLVPPLEQIAKTLLT
jgi:YggT family protein